MAEFNLKYMKKLLILSLFLLCAMTSFGQLRACDYPLINFAPTNSTVIGVCDLNHNTGGGHFTWSMPFDTLTKYVGGSTPVIVSDSAWSLRGNSGTNSSTNFIGTTDNVPFIIKVNGDTAVYFGVTFEKAMGQNTTASGVSSFAIGDGTTAIGIGSAAMGQNTTASGDYSMAMGSTSVASGNYSAAMGDGTTASGLRSVSMGSSSIASGNNSVAMGSGVTASGLNSIAMGAGIAAAPFSASLNGGFAFGDYSLSTGRGLAKAFCHIVIGSSNDTTGYSTWDSANWVATDPLFTIGNSDGGASNAMQVLKNGKVGVGINYPSSVLDVKGDSTAYTSADGLHKMTTFWDAGAGLFRLYSPTGDSIAIGTGTLKVAPNGDVVISGLAGGGDQLTTVDDDGKVGVGGLPSYAIGGFPANAQADGYTGKFVTITGVTVGLLTLDLVVKVP